MVTSGRTLLSPKDSNIALTGSKRIMNEEYKWEFAVFLIS